MAQSHRRPRGLPAAVMARTRADTLCRRLSSEIRPPAREPDYDQRMNRGWLGIAILVLGTSLAQAQPGEPPAATEPPPLAPAGPPMVAPGGPPGASPAMPPQPAAPSRNIDPGVLEDANAGRGWMSPTALTEPGGTWSVSDYELFLLSIGYAVTDKLTLSATTVPPYTEDFPLWVLFNAKYQVVRTGRVRVALQGAITHFAERDSSNDSFTAGDLGGALTLCLDDGCHSHLSGFLAAAFARDTDSSVPFLAAATAVARVSKHVKLVLELDSAFVAGRVNDVADAGLLWYGARFTSGMIGVDVGLVRPLGVGADELVLGFPIVTFSYRSLD
jgi:hypothetical protein